ncbi:hypothetical protein MUP59_02015 [Candidatus Bathyarchaeota archaeon]|nr:hypothetical protein [Candidatus Bathyarchaeota archaeon]
MGSEVRTLTFRLGAKTGEIEVQFIRLPGFDDTFIRSGIVNIVNGAFGVSGQGGILEAGSPRLAQIDSIRWSCTVDVKAAGAATPWAIIAAAILGAVVAGAVIYWVIIRPLKETLTEIANDIDTVIKLKEQKVTAGEITQSAADEMDKLLEAARDKAKAAGASNWWDFLIAPLTGAIGIIVIILIVALVLPAVTSAVRRRREV